MDADFKQLLGILADEFETTPETIISRDATSSVALARVLGMALWSEGHSAKEAAEAFGRTRYAAINARERVRFLVDQESWFALKANAVLDRFLEPKSAEVQTLHE